MAYEASNIPGSVIVNFLPKQCAVKVSIHNPPIYQSTIPISSTQFSFKGFSSPGSAAKLFNDSSAALISTSKTPDNQSTLDALATQLANDYYDFVSNSFDITFNGSLSVAPVAYYDFIIISMDEDDNLTRVVTPPITAYPDEMNHYDPAADQCASDPDPKTFNSGADAVDSFPCITIMAPPAKLSANLGSNPYGVPTKKPSVMKLCLEDGRLISYYQYIKKVNICCQDPVSPNPLTMTVNGSPCWSQINDIYGQRSAFQIPFPLQNTTLTWKQIPQFLLDNYIFSSSYICSQFQFSDSYWSPTFTRNCSGTATASNLYEPGIPGHSGFDEYCNPCDTAVTPPKPGTDYSFKFTYCYQLSPCSLNFSGQYGIYSLSTYMLTNGVYVIDDGFGNSRIIQVPHPCNNGRLPVCSGGVGFYYVIQNPGNSCSPFILSNATTNQNQSFSNCLPVTINA